jgi:hypothetical protein
MRQLNDQDSAGLRWSSRCKETEHRRRATIRQHCVCPCAAELEAEIRMRPPGQEPEDTSTTTRCKSQDVYAYTCMYVLYAYTCMYVLCKSMAPWCDYTWRECTLMYKYYTKQDIYAYTCAYGSCIRAMIHARRDREHARIKKRASVYVYIHVRTGHLAMHAQVVYVCREHEQGDVQIFINNSNNSR